MADQRPTRRDDTRLFRLYTECEQLFDNLNRALLEGKMLSVGETAQLQHCLDTEGCKIPFQKLVKMRLKLLKDRKIVVLVAGEYSAGKSTFINVLMGGKYLPMGRGKVSQVVCEIQHSVKKQATITFTDRDEEECISLEEDGADSDKWEYIRYLIKTDVENTEIEHKASRIVIDWPIQALEGFSLAQSVPNDNGIEHVRGELSTRQFPTDFMEQLQRPYAHSFDENSQKRAPVDPQQTARKEVYTPSPNQPIPIAPQRLQQLKEPTLGSVVFASDEAPKTPSVYEYADAIDDSTRAPPEQDNDVNQQTAPKQIANDDSLGESTNEEKERTENFMFSFVDCPGIHENVDTTFKPSREEMNHCSSFFFIMDEARDHGVHENGIQQFMKEIGKSFKARNMDLRPDLLMFFANKIDLVDDSESMVIKQVLKKVNETWGLVKRSQILPFDARHVLSKQQDQPSILIETIQQHLSNCIWLCLEEQYVWLLNCLNIAACNAMYDKPPTAVKHVLAEPLRNTRQVAVQVQSELKAISEKDICENAWADLRKVLQSVGTFNDIVWNERDIVKELAARIGTGKDREKHVDWLVLYDVICEIICNTIETKIRSSDACREDLKSAQDIFHRAIRDLFRDQNKRLHDAQDMLPFQQGNINDKQVNGLLSAIAPILVSLTIRGAHVFLPFYFIAAPAAPVFLVGRAVWEEWKYAKMEAMREEFLQDRVTFMKRECEKIISNSVQELKDKTAISKSVLFRYFFKDIEEKRKIHEKTEALIKMTKYLENIEDQPNNSMLVDLFIRAATITYTEQVIDHDMAIGDICWEMKDGERCSLGEPNSNVFKATVNDNIEAAVKEFRFSHTGTKAESMFGYRECYNLRKLSRCTSDRIVKLLGTNIEKSNHELILRLVLEYHDGSLLDIVRSQSPRQPTERLKEFRHFTRECAECVQFLHDNDIIHRNIKPSNFLLTSIKKSYSRVVISDMGGLKSEDDLMVCTEGARKGTRAYLAPEITAMNTGHTKASDVYCLGLVIWELWYREPSYDNTKVIMNTEQFKLPPDDYPRTLLLRCLPKKANLRATVTELLEI